MAETWDLDAVTRPSHRCQKGSIFGCSEGRIGERSETLTQARYGISFTSRHASA